MSSVCPHMKAVERLKGMSPNLAQTSTWPKQWTDSNLAIKGHRDLASISFSWMQYLKNNFKFGTNIHLDLMWYFADFQSAKYHNNVGSVCVNELWQINKRGSWTSWHYINDLMSSTQVFTTPQHWDCSYWWLQWLPLKHRWWQNLSHSITVSQCSALWPQSQD